MFSCTLNGQPLAVNEAVVSAYPFNRVWPGHQRERDQTTPGFFAGFDLDGASELTVSSELIDPATLRVRPARNAPPFRAEKGRAVFTLEKPGSFTVECGNRRDVLTVFADPPFDAEKEKGGVLRFGPGEHDAGLIVPQSGQTIVFERGAVVHGMIFAKDAHDFRVIGRGILDSSRVPRGDEYLKDPDVPGGEVYRSLEALGVERSDLRLCGSFNAYHCRNFEVSGITLLDSPFWALITRNDCENVVVRNVKIFGQWRYNSDGIDLCTTKRALVEDCFVRSFDDCVVVRGRHLPGEEGDCADITVRRCVLWCDWGKSLEIFSGGKPTHTENVRFEDIDLIRLSGTGISIDTWHGSENTRVDRVVYRNIFAECEDPAPGMVFQKCDGETYVENTSVVPAFARLCFSDAGGRRKTEGASGFDVRYGDISFEGCGWSKERELSVELLPVEGCFRIGKVTWKS